MTLLAALHLLCIPLGIIYSNILEWVLHKYVLHGLGKNKKSRWASHWHGHHRSSRKNNNYDPDYSKGLFDPAARGEIIGLIVLGIFHLPLILVTPLFYITLIYCAIKYYIIHKKAHLDPAWCKQHLPWHYDHHMGKNQDANWGVTTDWVDRALGTRVEYNNSNN